MERQIFILFLTVLFCFNTACTAHNKMFAQKKGDMLKTGAKNYTLSPLNLYKKHISKIDGNRCSMRPSCSSYAVDSLKKHGFFLGWIMTCDRLMRCGGDEVKLSPKVIINGKRYCCDPVSANDFWW